MEAIWCHVIVCVDEHCHVLLKVTYIYVHNFLIVCGFIAKIDNKFIIILIRKELVNKFIVHLFPF